MRDYKHYGYYHSDLKIFLDELYRKPVKARLKKTPLSSKAAKAFKTPQQGRIVPPIISKTDITPPDWAKTARYGFKG